MTKNTSSNRAVVPEAKGALDRFKFEVANELGVPLTDGYNGNLTSKQNGSVGGYIVKKMIEQQERQMSGSSQNEQYSAAPKSVIRFRTALFFCINFQEIIANFLLTCYNI